jgi:hypothetical protein
MTMQSPDRHLIENLRDQAAPPLAQQGAALIDSNAGAALTAV